MKMCIIKHILIFMSSLVDIKHENGSRTVYAENMLYTAEHFLMKTKIKIKLMIQLQCCTEGCDSQIELLNIQSI